MSKKIYQRSQHLAPTPPETRTRGPSDPDESPAEGVGDAQCIDERQGDVQNDRRGMQIESGKISSGINGRRRHIQRRRRLANWGLLFRVFPPHLGWSIDANGLPRISNGRLYYHSPTCLTFISPSLMSSVHLGRESFTQATLWC